MIVATLGGLVSAERVTANILKQCKEMVTNTTSELEEHLQKIDSRGQIPSSQGARTSGEDVIEREKVQEERTASNALPSCTQASEQVDKVHVNVFEDVSAAQDADQVIVATLEDLISAKQVTAGIGATHVRCCPAAALAGSRHYWSCSSRESSAAE